MVPSTQTFSGHGSVPLTHEPSGAVPLQIAETHGHWGFVHVGVVGLSRQPAAVSASNSSRVRMAEYRHAHPTCYKSGIFPPRSGGTE